MAGIKKTIKRYQESKPEKAEGEEEAAAESEGSDEEDDGLIKYPETKLT